MALLNALPWISQSAGCGREKAPADFALTNSGYIAFNKGLKNRSAPIVLKKGRELTCSTHLWQHCANEGSDRTRHRCKHSRILQQQSRKQRRAGAWKPGNEMDTPHQSHPIKAKP